MSGKERLAIVHALRSWHHYVQGEQLKVVTGHKSFVRLMDNSLKRGKLEKWVRTIQNISFEIAHRLGTRPVAADTLSRRIFPHLRCTHCHELLLLLHETPALRCFWEWLEAEAAEPSTTRRAAKEETLLHDKDGLLCRRKMPGSRVYVPADYRREELRHYHDTKMHGHYGLACTVDTIAKRFWWSSMRADCKAHLHDCSAFQLEKTA